MSEIDGDNMSRLKVDKWTSGVKQRRHSVPYTLPITAPSSAAHKKALSPLKEYRGGTSPSGIIKSCVNKDKNEGYVNIDKKIPQNSPIRKMLVQFSPFTILILLLILLPVLLILVSILLSLIMVLLLLLVVLLVLV